MNSLLGQPIYRLVLIAALFNIRAGYTTSKKTLAPIDKTPMYQVISGQMVLDRSNILQIVDPDKQGFNGQIKIEKDDTFSVLSTQTRPDGTVAVELGIDSDFSQEPNVIWIKAQALRSIQTKAFDPEQTDLSLDIYSNNVISSDDDGASLNILLSDNPDLLGDFVSTETASAKGGRAKRHHHGGKGMTHCLRDVRVTLAKMGLCHSSSFGVEAGNAYGPIEHQCGFSPVSYSESMPKGSVCISQGGDKNCGGKHFQACGHAAVDIGNGKWKGAGLRNSPMLSGHADLECLAPTHSA